MNESLRIKFEPLRHSVALRRLRRKKTIRCAFFVLSESIWKYDYVFRLMLASPRFEPFILVCPRTGWGEEFTQVKMDAAKEYFEKKAYPTYVAFDKTTGKYMDVRKELSPDMIFYCSPYEGVIHQDYFITNFPDKLTVYVPYAFNSSNDFSNSYDLLLHNLVWRYYAESEEHKKYAEGVARNKGRNVVVTGYPGIDPYMDKSYVPSFGDWKVKDSALKRIIWAPHHTIVDAGTIIYSCFLRYCDLMPKLAEKYSGKAQFVFKPHPLLRPKLELSWGKENTDDYYRQWEEMPNTSYSEGNYVDLFLTSDAMIHDSGSFITEYLFVNKPVMRTMNDYPVEEMYNEFTRRSLEYYYKGYSAEDIEEFIVNVIEGVDPMKEAREAFVKSELMPAESPSGRIVKDILESIEG